MESRKIVENKANFSSDEVASKFSEQHPPPFEDEKRRKEFVSNVQLRCENILNQVRLFKGTSDVNAVSKDSAESSGSNLTNESSSGSGSNQRQTLELSQALSVEQRVARIMSKLLRDCNIPISISEMENNTREESTRRLSVQLLEAFGIIQEIPFKDFVSRITSNVGRGTSDGHHSALGSSENADEKTKPVISNTATEEQASKGQVNTELTTAEECCDGLKNAPASERRDEDTERGGEKLSECEGSSGESVICDFNKGADEKERLDQPASLLDVRKFYYKQWGIPIANENSSGLCSCSCYRRTKMPGFTVPDIVSARDDRLPRLPVKRRTSEQTARMDRKYYEIKAKQIVQEVFNSIGCYENFVRRADWADEPCSPPGELVTIPVAYNILDPYKKISKKDETQPSISGATSDQTKQDDKRMPTSEITDDDIKEVDEQLPTSEVTSDNEMQDDRQLSISERVTFVNEKQGDGELAASGVTCTSVDDVALEVLFDDVKQDDVQLPTSGVTCTDIASATLNTSEQITENNGEPSAVVTSSDIRDKSLKRLSLKRGRKRWAELKKKPRSFVVGKRMGSRKGLISKLPATEATPCIKEETHYRLTVDEEKLAALKEFIALGGTKTIDGEDVVVLNPSKIPSKREFTGKKEYNDVMDCLLSHAQKVTDENVETDNFVLTVHSAEQRRSRLRSRKWAMEFYKFLKQRHQDRLTRCVLFKPSLKLRALVVLSRPFLSDKMKEKIYIVRSRRDFATAQGLPESASCI